MSRRYRVVFRDCDGQEASYTFKANNPTDANTQARFITRPNDIIAIEPIK